MVVVVVVSALTTLGDMKGVRSIKEPVSFIREGCFVGSWRNKTRDWLFHCWLSHHTAICGSYRQSRTLPNISFLKLDHDIMPIFPASYIEFTITVVPAEGMNNN